MVFKSNIIIHLTSIFHSPLTAWWLQVCLVTVKFDDLSLPRVCNGGRQNEDLRTGVAHSVMSGGRVSEDWDQSSSPDPDPQDSLGSGPGPAPSSRLSRRFGWNFHWRKPRASRGGTSRAGPQAAATPDRGLRTKKWLCSALSSAGCRAPLCRRGWCRAYKTSKNPGQVFTCEAAKPRQGPGSSRSPWPDPGPTYVNDFPWIPVKW